MGHREDNAAFKTHSVDPWVVTGSDFRWSAGKPFVLTVNTFMLMLVRKNFRIKYRICHFPGLITEAGFPFAPLNVFYSNYVKENICNTRGTETGHLGAPPAAPLRPESPPPPAPPHCGRVSLLLSLGQGTAPALRRAAWGLQEPPRSTDGRPEHVGWCGLVGSSSSPAWGLCLAQLSISFVNEPSGPSPCLSPFSSALPGPCVGKKRPQASRSPNLNVSARLRSFWTP